MIWGCFLWGKCGPLVIFPKGSINGKRYVTMLEENLMGFWMEQSEEHGYVVIQEDNAPIHTCKLAKQWKESMDMVSLEWPPNSPDLNPIEHIWYQLKVNIQNMQHQPTTFSNLTEAIKKSWDDLDGNFINKLVESKPKKIKKIINEKGGNTKY